MLNQQGRHYRSIEGLCGFLPSKWDRVIEQLLLVSSHQTMDRSCVWRTMPGGKEEGGGEGRGWCCTWRTLSGRGKRAPLYHFFSLAYPPSFRSPFPPSPPPLLPIHQISSRVFKEAQAFRFRKAGFPASPIFAGKTERSKTCLAYISLHARSKISCNISFLFLHIYQFTEPKTYSFTTLPAHSSSRKANGFCRRGRSYHY